MIHTILYSSGEWWVKVVSWYTIMVYSMKFLLYDTTDGNLRLSSFVIKLHAKLIMGWDEEAPANKELDFERIAFSPGIYLKD